MWHLVTRQRCAGDKTPVSCYDVWYALSLCQGCVLESMHCCGIILTEHGSRLALACTPLLHSSHTMFDLPALLHMCPAVSKSHLGAYCIQSVASLSAYDYMAMCSRTWALLEATRGPGYLDI